MSETLLAVIVGGVIGAFVPALNLLMDGRRWKRQAKLDILRSKQAHLRERYLAAAQDMVKDLGHNSFLWPVVAELLLYQPIEKLVERLEQMMKRDEELSPEVRDRKAEFLTILTLIQSELREVDSQILQHVS